MTRPEPSAAGPVLTRCALGAGLWLVGTCLAAGLLSAVGLWWPVLAWVVAGAVAAGVALVVRRLPGVTTTRGAAVALVAVCVGFAVYAGTTHSEHVMPRRDAASNLQAAVSLVTTHERVVPADVAPFGGAAPFEGGDLTLASAAFYQVGDASDPSVQPQFLMAPAVVYGYGVLAGGPGAAMLLPAVGMALVLLLLGLLGTRVAGPWWGVAAAGLTGLLFPVLNVARGTYSEQLALVTLVGGLLALTLAVDRDGPDREGVGAGRLALVGGVLVGGTGVARVDALREVTLLLPLLAVGVALGRSWARPALVGLAGSTAAAYALAWGLSYRYLGDIHASLLPLVALTALVGALSWAGVRLWSSGRRLPAAVVRRAPDVVAALTVLAGVVLWSRPWWLTVRQDPQDPGARYVAGMQRRQGMVVDGGRTYAEHTVDWLSWYVGWAALVVALVALALLLRHLLARLADGELVGWGPALVVAAGSTLLTLVRPGITPDHPWADRRLLVALPFVVLLVVAGARWAADRLAARGGAWGRWARPVAVVAVLLGVGVPALSATWPFRGVGVERGSLQAAADVCAVLPDDAVVLGVDGRAWSEWPQVVRGMCGVPYAVATTPVREDPQRLRRVVDATARAAEASGRTLVVLAADGPEAIEGLGLEPRPVVDIRFPEEEHALDRPPRRTDVGGIRVSVATVPAG